MLTMSNMTYFVCALPSPQSHNQGAGWLAGLEDELKFIHDDNKVVPWCCSRLHLSKEVVSQSGVVSASERELETVLRKCSNVANVNSLLEGTLCLVPQGGGEFILYSSLDVFSALRDLAKTKSISGDSTVVDIQPLFAEAERSSLLSRWPVLLLGYCLSGDAKAKEAWEELKSLCPGFVESTALGCHGGGSVQTQKEIACHKTCLPGHHMGDVIVISLFEWIPMEGSVGPPRQQDEHEVAKIDKGMEKGRSRLLSESRSVRKSGKLSKTALAYSDDDDDDDDEYFKSYEESKAISDMLDESVESSSDAISKIEKEALELTGAVRFQKKGSRLPSGFGKAAADRIGGLFQRVGKTLSRARSSKSTASDLEPDMEYTASKSYEVESFEPKARTSAATTPIKKMDMGPKDMEGKAKKKSKKAAGPMDDLLDLGGRGSLRRSRRSSESSGLPQSTIPSPPPPPGGGMAPGGPAAAQFGASPPPAPPFPAMTAYQAASATPNVAAHRAGAPIGAAPPPPPPPPGSTGAPASALHLAGLVLPTSLDHVAMASQQVISSAEFGDAYEPGDSVERGEEEEDDDDDDLDKELEAGVEYSGSASSQSVEGPQQDRVCFTCSAPMSVRPGGRFMLEVLAYLEEHYAETLERIKRDGKAVAGSQTNAVQVDRDVELHIAVALPGVVINKPEKKVKWSGERTSAKFSAKANDDVIEGTIIGTVMISCCGLAITRFLFELKVACVSTEGEDDLTPCKQETLKGPPSSVFVSFDEQDHEKVARYKASWELLRVQVHAESILMMRAQSGWDERMREFIVNSDVLVLFWSRYSHQNDWVEREWQCCRDSKGLDHIQIVSIVSLNALPLPPELLFCEIREILEANELNEPGIMALFCNPTVIRVPDGRKKRSPGHFLPSLLQEMRGLQDICNAKGMGLRVQAAATKQHIERGLIQYTPRILLFVGHAADGQYLLLDEADGGVMDFANIQWFKDRLRQYRPPLQCVFLNACKTASFGRALSESLGIDVVCWDSKVDDRCASAFSQVFFQKYADTHNVEEAFKAGEELFIRNNWQGDPDEQPGSGVRGKVVFYGNYDPYAKNAEDFPGSILANPVEHLDKSVDVKVLLDTCRLSSGTAGRILGGNMSEISIARAAVDIPNRVYKLLAFIFRKSIEGPAASALLQEAKALSDCGIGQRTLKVIGGRMDTALQCPIVITEDFSLVSVEDSIGDLQRAMELDRLDVCLQIAEALRDLHAANITHKSLSLSSVFMDRSFAIKVAVLPCREGASPARYISPEVLRGEEWSKSADIYAFGVCMWEILTGERALQHLDEVQVAGAVIRGEKIDTLKLSRYDKSAMNFVGECLSDENFRPSASQAVSILTAIVSTPSRR